jgi:hypothetical protein
MLPRLAAVNGGRKVPRGNRRNKKNNVLLCCYCWKWIHAPKMQRYKSQCPGRPWLGESQATRHGSETFMVGQGGTRANRNRSGNNLKKDKDEDEDKDEDKDENMDTGYSPDTDDKEEANSFSGKIGKKKITSKTMMF